MGSLGYKLIGIVVVKGGKLYLRRRYGRCVPSRRTTLVGLLGLLAAGTAVAAARKLGGPPAG